jgi:hypothetical protein
MREFAAGFGWNLFGEKIRALLERIAPERDGA